MKTLITFLLMPLLIISSAAVASAQPVCATCAHPPLSYRVNQANLVVFVQLSDAEKLDNSKIDESRTDEKKFLVAYEVLEVLRATQSSVPQKGELIKILTEVIGKKGDFFLLLGTSTDEFEWAEPVAISEPGYEYIKGVPPPESPPQKQIEYRIKYLEHPDPIVADDAYTNFASAPYEEIKRLAKVIPRVKLRSWLTGSEVPTYRWELYGKFLGLHGNEKDIEFFEELIFPRTNDSLAGIDGVMIGYLLLTGEGGLEIIEETKLRNEDVPFNEVYAAILAMRFMWQYEDMLISHQSLLNVMRNLLDRPELADLVINDLASWKDWNSQDRVVALYDAEDYNVRSIKRSIVRFLIVSTNDVSGSDDPMDDSEVPEHAVRAETQLNEIQEKDPKLVAEVERSYPIKRRSASK